MKSFMPLFTNLRSTAHYDAELIMKLRNTVSFSTN